MFYREKIKWLERSVCELQKQLLEQKSINDMFLCKEAERLEAILKDKYWFSDSLRQVDWVKTGITNWNIYIYYCCPLIKRVGVLNDHIENFIRYWCNDDKPR